MARAKPPAPRAPRPEVLAFLRSIKENPSDDTPRLVLADWLEEHGDESDDARGRFLRLECEAEKLPPEDDLKKQLERQAGELWNAHHRAWVGALEEIGARRGKRGLLRVRESTRILTTKKSAQLARTEAWSWVDSLRLISATPPGLANLHAAHVLDGLNHLSLRDCPIRAAGVEALAKMPELATLTSLDLEKCWIEHHGAQKLAQAPFLINVLELNLNQNMLWPDSLGALARSRRIHRLRKLEVGDHKFRNGAKYLADAPWLPSLEELDLSSTWTEDGGIIPLVKSPGVRGLVALDLAQNKITSKGAVAIAESPHLERLAVLELHSNSLGDEGVAAIAASPLLGRLQRLDVGYCGLGLAGLRALIGSPHWGNLRSLSLYGADCGVVGASLLAETPARRRLDLLEIGGNGFGDESVHILAEAMAGGRIGLLRVGWGAVSPALREELLARFGERVEIYR